MNYTGSGSLFTSFLGHGGFQIMLSSNETETSDFLFNNLLVEDWLSYGVRYQ